MKFTKIALAVVAVMAGGVVGGSWYTGKQAEEKYHQIVAEGNKALKVLEAYGAKAEIKDVEFKRHFFNSEVTYRVEVALEEKTLDIWGNDTLYHGPLPLNRLAKFNLTPMLMSMENRLQAPEVLKAVIGQELGQGTANVSYAGVIEGDFTLNPMKYQDQDGAIESSPLKLDYEYDASAKNGHSRVTLDKIMLRAAEGFSIQADGLSYADKRVDDHGYPYLGLGEFSLTLKNLSVKNQTQSEIFTLQESKATSHTRLQGDRMVQDTQWQSQSMKVDGVDLGKVNSDVSVDWDAKSTNELLQYAYRPERLETEEAGKVALQLLNNAPKFHLNKFALENGKGKAQVALFINLVQADVSAVKDMQAFISLFSQSKLSMQINREYLEEITRQIGVNIEKLSEQDAAIKAKQMADEVFANAIGSGVAQVVDNQLSSELSVNGDKVVLNNREVSESELQVALFALAMMFSSLGQ